MLEKLSDQIVSYLTKKDDVENLEKMKLKLGSQILLHNIGVLFSILFLAVCMGMGKECFLFLTVFISFRTVIGGIHLKHSWSCTIVTTLLILGGTKLALIPSVKKITEIIWMFVLVILILVFAPRGTKRNPIQVDQIIPRKIAAIGECLICMSIIFFAEWNGNMLILGGISSAIFLVILAVV